MTAYKDEKRGTWYANFRYRDWRGECRRRTRRGFRTKREAAAWEKSFKQSMAGVASMPFPKACEVYLDEIAPRIRESTMLSKRRMHEAKVLPFFGGLAVGEIDALKVMEWGNWLMLQRTGAGKPLSSSYLDTITSQLSAVLNHLVRLHGLSSNPVPLAGSVDGRDPEPTEAWTVGEYLRFSEETADRPQMHLTFEILFWCGLRRGELLALETGDVDLARGTIRVSKSLSRVGGRDVAGPPKTRQSHRTVTMPRFLVDEVAEYLSWNSGADAGRRLLPKVAASSLAREMARCADAAGVKRIRLHDLRHSHATLLVEKGFSVPAIAARLGHSGQTVTHGTCMHTGAQTPG